MCLIEENDPSWIWMLVAGDRKMDETGADK